MYKIPFQLLCNHFRLIEEIKAVESWRGQDRIPGSLRTEPTLTIRFLPANTNSIGNYIEECDQSIELKIITTMLSENDMQFSPPEGRPDHDLVAGLINASLRERYFRLSDLEDFSDLAGTDEDLEIMNTLQRTRFSFHEPADGKLVTTIIYRCQLYDFSALPIWQSVEAGFEVEEYHLGV